MMLAEFGTMQMLIVLGVIVLLFGASRIPDTMRNLGRGLSEFKKGLRESEDEAKRGNDTKTEDAKKS